MHGPGAIKCAALGIYVFFKKAMPDVKESDPNAMFKEKKDGF
jgi:hypothetical protein